MHIQQIELVGQDRGHQHHYCDQHGHPETQILHGLSQGAHIGPSNDIVIEIVQHEIPNQTAPNGHMVDNGPVGGVKRYLMEIKRIKKD